MTIEPDLREHPSYILAGKAQEELLRTRQEFEVRRREFETRIMCLEHEMSTFKILAAIYKEQRDEHREELRTIQKPEAGHIASRYVNLRVRNFAPTDVVTGAVFRYIGVADLCLCDPTDEEIGPVSQYLGVSDLSLCDGGPDTKHLKSKDEVCVVDPPGSESPHFVRVLGKHGHSFQLSMAVLLGGTSSGVIFEKV